MCKLRFFGLICLAFFSFGCSNFFNNSKTDELNGEKGIYVSFSSMPASTDVFSSERAAFPNIENDSFMSGKSAKLKILDSGGNPISSIGEIAGKKDGNSFYFPFSATASGTYKAKISIYKGSDEIASAITGETFLWNGKSASITISLKPNTLSNVNGSIFLSYDLPSDYSLDTTNTKIISGKTLSGTVITTTLPTVYVDDSTREITKDDCSPGVYTLGIILKKAGISAAVVLQEITVWPGFQTNLWYFPDGNTTQTLSITPQERMQFYVRGTKVAPSDSASGYWYLSNSSIQAVEGNDSTGDGSIAKPYATVAKAASQCKGEGPYTIYVDGKTSESAEITVDSNIAIQGLTEKATISRKTDNNRNTMLNLMLDKSLTMKRITFDGSKVILTESNKTCLSISGEANLTNCKIENCYSATTSSGGGVYVGPLAKLTMKDSSITNCKAQYGGAIYIITDSDTECLLENVTITDCVADGNGGAIWIRRNSGLRESFLNIKGNSKIDRCKAANGSAIFIFVGSKVTIKDNVVIGNENGYSESGGTILRGNLATGDGNDGATIYVDLGTLELKDNAKICGNKAKHGGGVHIDRTGVFNMSGGVISKNEITGNGGGVNVDDTDGTFNMTGGSIEGNKTSNNADTKGGGVQVAGTFNFSGGTIKSNSATVSVSSATGYGGGVAIFGGKMFMYGSAVIGNKDATVVATVSACSNYAQKGGGIYNNGSLYLGYSSATSTGEPDDEADFSNDGGIYYNYAQGVGNSSGGGGICNVANLYMRDGRIGKNGAKYGGGVLVSSSNSVFKMSGGIVKNNEAESGGGVYLSTGNINFSMNGGIIQNNKATSNAGGGGGVYVSSDGTFTMAYGTIKDNASNNNGGGVYNFGKMFMYGSAVIGDKNAAETATTNNHSNYSSTSGGGIYNNGKLYLGYSSATSTGEPDEEAEFTGDGGVYYNYASLGGGICNSNALYINSGYIVFNASRGNGGGIYLDSSSNTTLSGGGIIHNKCVGSGKGSGIYHNGNRFTIKVDGNINTDNDIYLDKISSTKLKTVNIDGGLESTEIIVAQITPAFYVANLGVLSGDINVNYGGKWNYTRFTVTDENPVKKWEIDSYGKLQRK
ncbi:right-handed parallel beta-helix repeat-containing protein [Treponema pectinovorum]|uniref:right-handed parallel beta-helix repeat-containing protein n=1 Tax=Treponema pectinovorum TaxID=164 RepID=UPI0011C97291|nr:right-handed parallel beta-helix repeat-containing protein [Treponema pectinovorum]